MSVDFAIFDPAYAPRDGAGFRAWYEERVDWDIESDDPDPSILTPPLLSWYTAMTARFPDLVRSGADPRTTIDYSFTSDLMYCSMPNTPLSNDAWSYGQEQARQIGLGIYDCMSDDRQDNSCIIFPEGPLKNEPSFFSKLFGKAKD